MTKDQYGDHKTLWPIVWTPKIALLVLSWNKIKWWWFIVKKLYNVLSSQSYISDKTVWWTVEVRKVSSLATQTLFIVVCSFWRKRRLRWRVVRTQLERFRDDARWRVSESCSAILHSNTSTTCLKLSHTSPSFSTPHYPWTDKNYLNGGCTKIWISWRSI